MWEKSYLGLNDKQMKSWIKQMKNKMFIKSVINGICFEYAVKWYDTLRRKERAEQHHNEHREQNEHNNL